MKRILSMLLVVSMLLGCALALGSCSAPANYGAEISVYLGESVYDFDPTDYFVENNARQVLSLLFEPLFSLNSRGGLENAAAAGYRVDKNERQIVINLKESYWSDAIRVTAEDFIFAWRDVVLEPNNANPAAALFYDIENAYEVKTGEKSVYEFGAIASDVYEITITYREGADYNQLLKNLASVATAPLRQDKVTDSTAGYWSKLLNSAVTNGPFRLEDVEPASFTVTRNNGYHQDPTVVNPTGIVTPNKLVTFNDLSGENKTLTYDDIVNKVVFYMGDASLADRKANKDNAKVTSDLSTYSYVFNTENPLFAIKEVRQALSMVINREAIIEAITFGKAATGFLPSGVIDTKTGKTFTTEQLIAPTAKVEQAKKLIEGKIPEGVSKSFTLTVANDEESMAIADIVKGAWQSLGFTVTVKGVAAKSTTIKDFATNSEITITDSTLQVLVNDAARGVRNFDVIGVDWQMYSKDAFVPLSAFATTFSGCGADFENNTHFGSFGGYSNVDYDALIKAAYEAETKEARSEALHEAEKLLVDSACIVPLVFNESFAFVSRDLSGISFDGYGNVVFTRVSQRDYEKYLEEF